MKTKFRLVLVVMVMLAALLSACNRPASEGPAATPTEGFPFPLATQGVGQFATQTAAAKLPAVVTATPKPGTNPTQAPATGVPATAVAPQPTAAQPVEKPTDKPPVVIPTLTRPEQYTIQQGEFPYCIARRFNLNIADLMGINGLSIDTRPAVGTTLKIPQTGSWSGERALAAHPTTYTVQANDSVGAIACKFGDVSPEAILAANGLKNASEIQAGQRLQIP